MQERIKNMKDRVKGLQGEKGAIGLFFLFLIILLIFLGLMFARLDYFDITRFLEDLRKSFYELFG